MFPGIGDRLKFETNYTHTSEMHPDAGAIIGISLAASVLVVALLFLCVLQFCCTEELKPASRQRRRRDANARPSTSSRIGFANFGFPSASRGDISQGLSAVDLHHQHMSHNWNTNNRSTFGSTGILNPIWQLRCSSCETLPTAPRMPHHCHLHPSQISVTQSNPCLFCCQDGGGLRTFSGGHDVENQDAVLSDGSVSSNRFQFLSPQLVPPIEESPPPYPGENHDSTTTDREIRSGAAIVHNSEVVASDISVAPSSAGPPPYSSPKY